MKTRTSVLKVFSACLIILFLSGCAATVKFAYEVKKPAVVENKVNSNATIYLSLVDLRPDPVIIGYMDNMFGMRVKKIKSDEPDITKSIQIKYKEELSKNGFKFSDNENNSDLILGLSITTFLAEMKPGLVELVTQADCCMKVSLVSGKENTEIYKTNVCGKGEKTTPVIAGKKDIPEALSFAVDSVLSKLLNDMELIKSINKFK
jgi:uncharacterized lipoprotein YajG